MGTGFNSNLPTLSAWSIAAYQFAFDYSSDTDYDNGAGETSITRLGGNLLWYFDNPNEMTPFVMLGAGVQIFGNNGYSDNDSGLFGSIGGGVEYQIQGDVSLVAEGKWLYAGDGDGYFLTNIGIKYSFGQ